MTMQIKKGRINSPGNVFFAHGVRPASKSHLLHDLRCEECGVVRKVSHSASVSLDRFKAPTER